MTYFDMPILQLGLLVACSIVVFGGLTVLGQLVREKRAVGTWRRAWYRLMAIDVNDETEANPRPERPYGGAELMDRVSVVEFLDRGANAISLVSATVRADEYRRWTRELEEPIHPRDGAEVEPNRANAFEEWKGLGVLSMEVANSESRSWLGPIRDFPLVVRSPRNLSRA